MSRQVLWQGKTLSPVIRYVALSIVGVVFALVLVIQLSVNESQKMSATDFSWFGFLWVISIYATFSLSSIQCSVVNSGFIIDFGPLGWPKKSIDWEHVVSVEVINVRPTEWGGWGYRWVPWKKATAAVMRAGEGLHFKFANGKQFVVTVDDAENALAAIRRALDELPPSN